MKNLSLFTILIVLFTSVYSLEVSAMNSSSSSRSMGASSSSKLQAYTVGEKRPRGDNTERGNEEPSSKRANAAVVVEEEKNCSICLELIVGESTPLLVQQQRELLTRVTSGCGTNKGGQITHYFHQACLDEWLKSHEECPVCKKTLEPSGNTALHQAVLKRDIARVQQLFNTNVDIDAQNDDYCTPLHLAVLVGDIQIVDALLNHGANIEARDCKGNTPLLLAGLHSDDVLALLLINHGANIDTQDNKGYTLLHIAVDRDDLEFIQMLRNKRAAINICNKGGYTVFHLAAESGNAEVVRRLFTYDGAMAILDVQTRVYGQTALYVAAHFGHTEIVDEFLKRGANREIYDLIVGYRPLHAAVAQGHVATVQRLLNSDRDEYPLARYLDSTNGANKDAQDNSGNTPLHLAAQEGNVALVRLLLDKGANRGIKNNDGRTAYDVAVRFGHSEELIDLLRIEQRFLCVIS